MIVLHVSSKSKKWSFSDDLLTFNQLNPDIIFLGKLNGTFFIYRNILMFFYWINFQHDKICSIYANWKMSNEVEHED